MPSAAGVSDARRVGPLDGFTTARQAKNSKACPSSSLLSNHHHPSQHSAQVLISVFKHVNRLVYQGVFAHNVT